MHNYKTQYLIFLTIFPVHSVGVLPFQPWWVLLGRATASYSCAWYLIFTKPFCTSFIQLFLLAAWLVTADI